MTFHVPGICLIKGLLNSNYGYHALIGIISVVIRPGTDLQKNILW